jgi:hypothetical protein
MTSHLQAANLFRTAADFENAYRVLTGALPKPTDPSWPRCLLLSYSIELALKAFLAATGKSTSDLIERRHDLKKLLREAVKCRLVLGPRARDDIKLLSEAHEKHWARYPKKQPYILQP